MPDTTASDNDDGWRRAAELPRLHDKGRLTVRLGSRQIALFLVGEDVHACNNRCPHEGYPLVEGALDDDCVLTCQWHNWKFDLRTGANHYGGDALRIYPVRLRDDAVWVDVSEPSAAEKIARLQAGLDAAMDERDTPRIAREAARLGRAGVAPEAMLTHAIGRGHDRLRYGMTHAFAAAEVWLRLRDERGDDAERLMCLTEALDHIAFDTLREPAYPFTPQVQAWDEARFLGAVEAQDEATAASTLLGALEQALCLAEFEATLCRAALAHYNDFGHSLIYLVHIGALADRRGPAALRPLLLAWLRSLIFATREDLLPDFKAYAPALAAWRASESASAQTLEPERFVGKSIAQTLACASEAAGAYRPCDIAHALLGAAAEHLLRFDTRHEQRSDNAVTDNVGWLDFTHAITFASAVRRLCTRHPALWPQGLLQLACFVARNSAYLGPPVVPGPHDAQALDAACQLRLLDHGLQPAIFAAHLLKTWDASRTERSAGVPEAVRIRLLAAIKRLFQATFKQKHSLRVARQALGFVQREE